MKALLFTDNRGSVINDNCDVSYTYTKKIKNYLIKNGIDVDMMICPFEWTTMCDFIQCIENNIINCKLYDIIIVHAGILDFLQYEERHFLKMFKSGEDCISFDKLIDENTNYKINNNKIDFLKQFYSRNNNHYDDTYADIKKKSLIDALAYETMFVPYLKNLDDKMIIINSNKRAKCLDVNFKKFNHYSSLSNFDIVTQSSLISHHNFDYCIDIVKWDLWKIKKYTFDNVHFTYDGHEYIYQKLKKYINLVLHSNNYLSHNFRYVDVLTSHYKIGIIGIFIKDYKVFFESFIQTVQNNFLPNNDKTYFIITDDPDYVDEVIVDTGFRIKYFIQKEDYIGWPYETLYRFEYILNIDKSKFECIDYIYFLNSNIKFLNREWNLIPPLGLVFVRHSAFINKPFEEFTNLETNTYSTAYFEKKDHDFYYCAGGFYGGIANKFFEMCNTLKHNISIDERNNYIAKWHDETHLNKYIYCDLKNKCDFLPICYHGNGNIIDTFEKTWRIIFLPKSKYIVSNSSNKDFSDIFKQIHGKIIKNKYNTSFFDQIQFNRIKIGRTSVDNIENVIDDLSNPIDISQLKNGVSFLLRIKNEALTIEHCILDIVNIADEIIVVDNNSTDGTKNILMKLEQSYQNIFLYEYNIDVPRVGKEHIDNYNNGTHLQKYNTLKTYYNWTLSKATYKKVVKWDGDFYCVRRNMNKLLHFINQNINNNIACFFSGVTVFIHNNNTYLKKINHYNEYRIFSKDYNFKWDDELDFINNELSNICETSWPAVRIMDKNSLFIFTKPIFLEIKNTSIDEFASRSSLLNDERDEIDKNILDTLSQQKKSPEIFHTNDIYNLNNFVMVLNCGKHIDNNNFIINEFRDNFAYPLILSSI